MKNGQTPKLAFDSKGMPIVLRCGEEGVGKFSVKTALQRAVSRCLQKRINGINETGETKGKKRNGKGETEETKRDFLSLHVFCYSIVDKDNCKQQETLHL